MSDTLVQKYTQKPQAVEAVQITEENMIELAQRVKGELKIKYHDVMGANVIMTVSRYPQDPNPPKAGLGEWIVMVPNELTRIVSNEEFVQKFEPNDLHFVHDDYSK